MEGDAGLCSTRREALHEPRRLHCPVVRMEDRAAKVRAQLRELVVPVRVEIVLTQRLELCADVGAFFFVGGQAQTADSAEGVARHRLQPVERMLGAPPELLGGLGTVRFARDVVAGGRSAQREAAVAAAGAGPDATRLVHPDGQTGLRQQLPAGAAGDPGADHGDVDLVDRARRHSRRSLVQPQRGAGGHGKGRCSRIRYATCG